MTMADCHCVCHNDGGIDCHECCPAPETVVATTPEPPVGTGAPINGDFGKTAGDHDQPYTYHPATVAWPTPFNQGQFARLLVLRGKVRAKRDDAA